MQPTREDTIPLRHVVSRSSREIKTGYQRFVRPVYVYTACYAPCRAACPAGHDIAWALQLAAHGRLDLARHAFREESPFPGVTGRVCYHPCEHACNRGGYDEAIAIHTLERTLSDLANGDVVTPPPRLYRESIGVVGAGPAGLTGAYHLARMGYPVTVYDANEHPGGALIYAIPAYRLPREVVAGEAASLHALGVAFRCGVRVGTDLSFATLREEHAAILLAPGLARARPFPVAAPSDPRIEAGLHFLRRAGAGDTVRLSGEVAVIGGGDVAIDAARTALRLGAGAVILCCPEPREEMPAHPDEVAAALAEGVQIRHRLAPVGVALTERGVELELAGVARVRRGDDGAVAIAVGRGRQTLRVSHLIYAVGQEADLSFLPRPLGEQARLRVGRWGETELPGVFAAGDVAGTYNVVNAVGSAKRAAVGIDAYLRGRSLAGVEAQIGIGEGGAISMRAYHALRRGEPSPPLNRPIGLQHLNLDYFAPARREVAPEVSPSARVRSFTEVCLPFTPEEALAEARRCFHCGTCDMCGNCFLFCPDSSVIQLEDWGFTIDLDHCKGCGVCVEECPRAAMAMVPEGEVAREGASG
ncbi:MAG: FAD-dependent oxidoreductase [Armatimonadota bacterium]|nr:FAD-dependent oxidoreductase [Armatimonadota bacterium]